MDATPKQSILIADDSSITIGILNNILKKNYNLLFAGNGTDALQTALTKEPDLILLDIMMPEMDGYEVCRKIKAEKRTEGIPLIFITSMNDIDDETLGLQTGAVDYITKPISPPIVLARIKTHLELKRQRDLIEKSMLKAKERVINHLSHELKTPLSVISSTLHLISKKLKDNHFPELERVIQRGQRNISRLLDLQYEIDDILNQVPVLEKAPIINLVETAANIAGIIDDESSFLNVRDSLTKRVSERLESLFVTEKISMEPINLNEVLTQVCGEASDFAIKRSLEITRNFEAGLTVTMDKNIMKKVFIGLVKNAIENSPDGSKIELTTESRDDGVWVHIRDYGVGITSQNQKLVFSGFFYTVDTELYSSKKHYDFNAGGAGSDLLRAYIFSKRYGFTIKMESTRCKFIPTDKDACPGQIKNCRFISDASGCFNSGGSIFSIKF